MNMFNLVDSVERDAVPIFGQTLRLENAEVH